eukprot:6243245-Prymnesium_polylepis.1
MLARTCRTARGGVVHLVPSGSEVVELGPRVKGRARTRHASRRRPVASVRAIGCAEVCCILRPQHELCVRLSCSLEGDVEAPHRRAELVFGARAGRPLRRPLTRREVRAHVENHHVRSGKRRLCRQQLARRADTPARCEPCDADAPRKAESRPSVPRLVEWAVAGRASRRSEAHHLCPLIPWSQAAP